MDDMPFFSGSAPQLIGSPIWRISLRLLEHGQSLLVDILKYDFAGNWCYYHFLTQENLTPHPSTVASPGPSSGHPVIAGGMAPWQGPQRVSLSGGQSGSELFF